MRLLDSWWLDVKLGVRMLVKFPGLTFAGVIGIAVAVAIAAGGVSVVQVNMLPASLPLDESARIVSIDLWDSRANSVEPRVLHEIPAWREGLKTVQDLGAFQDLSLNLIESGVPPESVLVAAISASGLRVARVRPLLGRLLNDADERAVLIGEEVWRNRFGSSAAILGRTIQLGAGSYEIAGVMPNGFGFPVHHRFWVPLRAASVSEPLTGPAVAVFGRLAPGAAMEDAQAELAAALQRRAAERPGLYANLRPRVASYVLATLQMQGSDDMAGIVAMQGIVVGLLVLVCLNVAVLVYTRTAMRQAEIGLRTALGAPRSRIVFQLFLEALVLSAVAALAGVGIAAFALHRIAGATQHIAAELPFWISFRLSPAAVAYAGALSVLAAVIIGVVPGLQATGRELRSGPRIAGAVETGSRLGTIWSLLIIAQVGFAVALLPTAVASVVRNLPLTLAGPGFAAGEYLTARLDQFPERHTELMRQLAADPRISRATLSSSEPGDERPARIDTENAAGTVHEVKFNRVDVNFFEAFDVPVLAGRSFQPGDASAASGAVVVNEPLANELFGGNALGQRIRYAGETGGRWYEIVGVVKNFPG
ncbi:MAG: FtsX-like permease family protein, partial [Acidobacteria bacterium]|nr:FtsX-like permease family protein [Acidobacteriota bacterium]